MSTRDRRRRVTRWVIGLVAIAIVLTTPPPASALGDEISSRIKAGYVVGGPVHALTAGWVVPGVTCGPEASSVSFQVGVGQRFAGQAVGVSVDCRGGKPTYYAWSVKERWRLRDPVERHDHIRITIRVRPRELIYQIVNTTQGWASGVGQFDGWPSRQPQRAWFLVKARTLPTGRTLPVAAFQRVQFHLCRVNNERISRLPSNKVVMTDRQGDLVATPGAFRLYGGFTVTQPGSGRGR